MKKSTLLLIILFLMAGTLRAQKSDSPDEDKVPLSPYIAATAGYVFKSDYNSIKGTVALNNIVFKRFGVYTSAEKGLDSEYFTNLWGITGSIHNKVYLYGGVDLFTKYGLFNDEHGVRKEMGIGFIPNKMLILKGGWSFNVGLTLGAGLRIPL